MLNSKAIAKIQTILLITITLLALGSGVAAYYFANTKPIINSQPTPTPITSSTPTIPTTLQPSATPKQTPIMTNIATIPTQTATVQPKDPIRIGVCADTDSTYGTAMVQGATLAAEQINAAGGLLGQKLMVVAEDDDSTTSNDNSAATNAINKLINVDKADFLVTFSTNNILYQDICSQQKKIHFSIFDGVDNLTQRVRDNYDKYKYTFRGEWLANGSTMNVAHVQSLALLKNTTGFTKVGYLLVDAGAIKDTTVPYFESELPKLGYQIVYRSLFSPIPTAMDFSSYFAQAEAAKTQILFVIATNPAKSAAIVNEWHNRQSPMLLCGDLTGAGDWGFWNTTSGNAEYVLTKNIGLTTNYPITSQTAPAKDAYLARWGVLMNALAAASFDTVKFFLANAINSAGSVETDKVINALEKIKVDTVLSNDFMFTSCHDIYVDASGLMNLAKTSMLYIVIQWQNGVQVPIIPDSLRAAAGVNLKYPPWPGPWS
jgi:branched-chain amino acid transport system substrate-binding protein